MRIDQRSANRMSSSSEEFETLVPSASRMTNNLRDLGYEFESAVADLVDNSVSAGASRIEVQITFAGPNSTVEIVDDGEGMDEATLSEAMRLGSGRDYQATDLGKFGMGLKTASLSQCRRVTVASKRSRHERFFRELDLDHVSETDRWEIRTTPTPADIAWLESSLASLDSGTLVRWSKMDRLLNFRDPWGGWAERNLLSMAERLELHLGMVFSKFIGDKRLSIVLNGNEVAAWDPFVVSEPATEALPVEEIRVRGGLVRVSPFVLPPKAEFSSDAAWSAASGPRQWNQQQGLYIYRADRLIQSGGWSGLRTRDEHSKLARVSVEFWPDLDDAFEINISKMRVKLPEELRSAIQDQVRSTISRANARYRSPSKTQAPTGASRPTRTPPVVAAKPNESPFTSQVSHPESTDRHAAITISETLALAADATNTSDALKAMAEHVRVHFPSQARDIGW